MSAANRTPEEIVAALSAFPDELSRLIADQPQDALFAPASDGGLGVVELLPHLRDWEQIFLDRVHAILHEDHPRLPAYDDDLWAIERDYRGQNPSNVLTEFMTLRSELVSELADVGQEGWQRTADHETSGEVTLHWLSEQIIESDADHLAQIREALG